MFGYVDITIKYHVSISVKHNSLSECDTSQLMILMILNVSFSCLKSGSLKSGRFVAIDLLRN